MPSLSDELAIAHTLSIEGLADTIQEIGFECTRCGKCCKGDEEDPHTATIFPDEIRELQSITDDKWENIARPMPYGLENNNVTFEWALQTQKDDCVFYEEPDKNMGKCTVHGSHPLICQTYPFSIEIFGTVESLGEKVDTAGFVTIHECEGIGRDIDRDHAEELAKTLKERAITEIEEAIAVTENYDPEKTDDVDIVVFDSEGAKHPDGSEQ